MKTTTKTETTIILEAAGDRESICIVIDADGKADVDGAVIPEDFERVAEALQTWRRDGGDWRSVCADHGYYGTRGGGEYRCPRCTREKERQEHASAGAAMAAVSS